MLHTTVILVELTGHKKDNSILHNQIYPCLSHVGEEKRTVYLEFFNLVLISGVSYACSLCDRRPSLTYLMVSRSLLFQSSNSLIGVLVELGSSVDDLRYSRA